MVLGTAGTGQQSQEADVMEAQAGPAISLPSSRTAPLFHKPVWDPGLCRLLVVDDDVVIRRALSFILKNERFKVDTTSGGRRALCLARQRNYDLVILDLHLPDLSGHQVCQHLSHQQGYEHVPILYLTGSEDKQELVTAFLNGAADYIRKPFHSTELLLRIRHNLELHQAQMALERANAELSIRALTDELTGISNRRHILEQVEQEFSRFQRTHAPFSVLTLDLDYFKQINDHHGHATGDYVLRQVARMLRQQLRRMDGLGRLGGEEFLILLPETRTEQAVDIAERLRQSITGSPMSWESQRLTVTTSIGVATAQECDRSISEILLRSDKALYAAKSWGRNTSCLYSGRGEVTCTDSTPQTGRS